MSSVSVARVSSVSNARVSGVRVARVSSVRDANNHVFLPPLHTWSNRT